MKEKRERKKIENQIVTFRNRKIEERKKKWRKKLERKYVDANKFVFPTSSRGQGSILSKDKKNKNQ